jgi:hypothetical protein
MFAVIEVSLRDSVLSAADRLQRRRIIAPDPARSAQIAPDHRSR